MTLRDHEPIPTSPAGSQPYQRLHQLSHDMTKEKQDSLRVRTTAEHEHEHKHTSIRKRVFS